VFQPLTKNFQHFFPKSLEVHGSLQYVCLISNSQTFNTHTMNQATRDNIDVAILSGRMTSVEAFEAVKHPDSKAYIIKYHLDEELEMHLKKAH